jgi:MFS transporter, DHA1 family, multidrug resistance protein
MHGSSNRNLILISFSQFGGAFSFNFIMVFLPFYIGRISPYSHEATLFWIGAIIGSTGICLAVTSPMWGYLTHRFSPKSLYLRGLVAHCVMFLLMGFTTHLPTLLVLRVLQGIFGGISTIGLIMISQSSPPARVTRDLGFYQNSITIGQLLGPPLGTLTAAAFGYKGAFIAASAVLFASAIFCYLYVTDVPRLPRTAQSSVWPPLDRRIVTAWLLCLVVQIQVMFLPSILPNVLKSLRIGGTEALSGAGILVMLYTMTAVLGTTLWCRLSRRTGLYRMIMFLGSASIFFQILLLLDTGIIGFAAIRMIQTGLVAAVVPLIFSMFTGDTRGSALGFLNSGRFVGNALGPIFATSVLAVSGLPFLYVMISGLTLVILVPFLYVFRGQGEHGA